MDLLVSLAYVVVLLAFIVLNEQIDKVIEKLQTFEGLTSLRL